MRLSHTLLIGAALVTAPATAARLAGAPTATAPATAMTLSLGHGEMVQLPAAMSDLFVASDTVADVQVRSPTQLYVFGKAAGETSIYATNKAGTVVWAANVRVGINFDRLQSMIDLAMPDQAVKATVLNGIVLLTGTVATPQAIDEATSMVQAFVGKDTQVITRLKTATPQQVNLRVRVAEVNRAFAKSVGLNLLSRDLTGGFQFGIGRGNPGTIADNGSKTFNIADGSTTLGFAGKLLGLDILSTLDLAETDGLSTTLAEPNLTALSGETASFLAGGEIPIPVPQYQGVTTIQYKQYGVSLAFSPVVLADGRISLHVAPEVSQLTTSTISINGYDIPGLTTRRAETTVELGSGQSFVIGGLLSNGTTNNVNKAPFLGDIPILGALFRSNSFRRNETELVIVVTPYLVKPVSANRVALPTDGYRTPGDGDQILEGQSFKGISGAREPKPAAGPTLQSPSPATLGAPGAAAATAPRPGFSFN